MKKSFIFLIFFILFISLVSCKKNDSNETSNDDNTSEEETKNEEVVEKGSVAVIYFSATNHTKLIAKYISDYYNVEAMEIIPEEEYTTEDLNYNNNSSRVYKEHSDASIRPSIKNNIDISSYTYIYLGYPIWWGQAPNILYTFVENTDLSGKTIYPFATSASSSIGSSATNLSLKSNAAFKEGRRFRINESKENIESWLLEHNLK